jgi:hypothetical protein
MYLMNIDESKISRLNKNDKNKTASMIKMIMSDDLEPVQAGRVLVSTSIQLLTKVLRRL